MRAPTHPLPAVRREIRFAAERGLPVRLTAREVQSLDAEIEEIVSALEARWSKESLPS